MAGEGLNEFKGRVNRAVERFKNTRVWRTIAWFNACNGGQLCAGIAYLSLFSLFAILTVGWSAFSVSLGNYPGLKEAVLDQINGWIPGLVGVEDEFNSYLVSPDQLILSRTLNWASVVAIVMGPIWIFRVMTALRTAVCRVTAVSRRAGNVLWDQSTKILGFLVLAAGLIVSAILAIATADFQSFLIVTFNIEVTNIVSTVLGVLSTLLGALINAVVMVGVIRLIARVWFASARKRRELWIACFAGGLLLAILRWLGTSLVARSATSNPLLSPFVTIIIVLVLADFTVRVLLMICAWIYNPPRLDSPKPVWLIKPRRPQSAPPSGAIRVTPFQQAAPPLQSNSASGLTPSTPESPAVVWN